MSPRRLLLALLIAVLGVAGASTQSRFAPLSEYLTAAVGRGDVPGVVALVVSRDAVLYEGAAGVPANAIFRIASMTKPVTSVAVMMLVDAGQVRLDDPTTRFLPDYPRLGTTRPTTIRHLLTHTSGIGYAWSSPILARLQRETQQSELELPRLHEPGERWTYGASTRVLGQLVEQVSGRPLDVFLRERIFEPLSMVDTTYTVPREKVSRVVTVHRRTGASLTEVPNANPLESGVRGDGGLYGTAQDYGRFMQMILNRGTFRGTRLLSEASVAAMGQNQIGDVRVQQQPAADAARSRPYPLGAGKDTFGLGFQIAAAPGEPGMRSPGSLSWGGINNTHFWIDPQRGIAVAFMTQVLPFYDERVIAALRDVERLVYAATKQVQP